MIPDKLTDDLYDADPLPEFQAQLYRTQKSLEQTLLVSMHSLGELEGRNSTVGRSSSRRSMLLRQNSSVVQMKNSRDRIVQDARIAGLDEALFAQVDVFATPATSVVVTDSLEVEEDIDRDDQAAQFKDGDLVRVEANAGWDGCVKPGEIGRLTDQDDHSEKRFILQILKKWRVPQKESSYGENEIRKATDEEVAEQIPCLIINPEDAIRLRDRGTATICIPKEVELAGIGCIPKRWIERHHSETVNRSIRQLQKTYHRHVLAKRALADLEDEVGEETKNSDNGVIRIQFKPTTNEEDDDDDDDSCCNGFGCGAILFQKAQFSSAIPSEWRKSAKPLDVVHVGSSLNDEDMASLIEGTVDDSNDSTLVRSIRTNLWLPYRMTLSGCSPVQVVGDEVRIKCSDRSASNAQCWVAGKIASKHSDGSVDVDYIEGGETRQEQKVKRNSIRTKVRPESRHHPADAN